MKRIIENKPLNIVIVVTYTYPYIGSGIGNVARSQAEILAKNGHNVTIISSNIPKTIRNFKYKNVTYLKLNANDFLERFHVPVPLFIFNIQAIKIIKKSDVVHVHDILYPSSFMAVIIAKFFRKKVVLTQHVPHVKYKNIIIDLIEKVVFHTMGLLTLYLSDSVFVINKNVQKWLLKYRKDIKYIPNGVDISVFNKTNTINKNEIRRKYNLPSNAFIVLFVGRFVPKKGFDILYRIKDPSYFLLFVGGGLVPDYMYSSNWVRIMGPKPQEELADLYKASDIFVLPSKGEGFPLSIQEAMASGLPIITSRDNNLDKTINNKLIHFVDINENSLKEEVKKLMNDAKLLQQMSKYSFDTAITNYSWDRNIELLLKIYYKNRKKVYEKEKYSYSDNQLG